MNETEVELTVQEAQAIIHQLFDVCYDADILMSAIRKISTALDAVDH